MSLRLLFLLCDSVPFLLRYMLYLFSMLFQCNCNTILIVLSRFLLDSHSTGYAQYLVARPKLYALILKQVPAHKIHFGKRVLNITEEDDKVTVHTNDNGMYVGDIVVGADGAYSAVRQRMYDRLKAKGELPKGDQEDLPFSCTCLVGQTRVLDPEKHPIIKEPICVFPTVHGADKPVAYRSMTGRYRVAVVVGYPAAARPGEIPLPRLEPRLRQLRDFSPIVRI